MNKLHKDDLHCSGIVLARRNTHPCAKRETCLRYTEHKRKEGSSGFIWYITASDDCGEYLKDAA